jgi:hypothetical protein
MKALQAFAAKLLGVSKTIIAFILPILKNQIGVSLEKLLPIALGIVTELASGQLSNSEKRDAAVKRLAAAATAQGISAGVSVLNLAVELAVANLKAETAPAE